MEPKTSAAAKTTVQVSYKLPMLAASPSDIGRLVRELESIDNILMQLKLKRPDVAYKMPHTSRLMDQLLQLNKLNLLEESDRKALGVFLMNVRKKAPVIHMSFSVDPHQAFIEKIMAWLRHEIHPLLLLTIGLQPSIGAGCQVRTTNKYFDFSLRQDFAGKHDLLLAKLAESAKQAQA